MEAKYLLTCGHTGLLPMTQDDVAITVAWRNEDRVRSQYLYQTPFTIASQTAYFHNMVETGKNVHLMIYDLESGKKIGCTVANSIDEKKRTAEVGVQIGEAGFQGKHHASTAIRTLGYFVCMTRPVDLVYARIYTTNIASLKMIQHAGFTARETLHDVMDSEGKPHDMILNVMEKDELIARCKDTVVWDKTVRYYGQ